MEIFDVYLPAGRDELVPREGRYFRILSGVGAMNVSSDTGVNSLIFEGIGVNLANAETGASFKTLRLRSPATQTVTVAVSMLPITDDRLIGTVKASLAAQGGFAGLPALEFASAGVQTIPANAERYRVDLLAGLDNSGLIWVGGTAAGEGIPLPARGAYQLTVTGPVSVFADTAGDRLHMAEVS